MYSIGRPIVPLHVLCGQWQEILKPDGTRFCLIVGTREEAEEVVKVLNSVTKVV